MKSVILDVAIVGGLLLAAYLGYRGGFTKKIFNLLVLIGSIIAGIYLMDPVGTLLQDLFLSPPWCFLAGIALVIIGLTTTAFFLYKRWGSTTVAKSGSQFFGVLFGLIEGGMVISLVLIAMKIADVPTNSVRTGSLLYKPLFNLAPKTFEVLRSYLPGAGDFADELNKTFKGLDLGGRVQETLQKEE